MRQEGKIGKQWKKTRREWIKLNPPNHEGYYVCWICSVWVPAEEMELDHIKSRTRFPKLRFVLTNLAPSCHTCNQDKGSGDAVNPNISPPEFYTEIEDLEELW